MFSSEPASAHREYNFDGIVGPSHNYSGLSFGNVASQVNCGQVSRPRAAARQGLEKMWQLASKGVGQGFFLPHDRPNVPWLRRLGFAGSDEAICAAAWADDPSLLRNATSASAMWTANSATVSPSPDTGDGRVHLTAANLSRMPHRSLEWEETLRQLQLIFGDARFFTVHPPVPAAFGDEGAANHMRISASHGQPGLEIFVYGNDGGGKFPARQSQRASQAVARLHGLDPSRTLLVCQSIDAIDAGAFHNDVVAVANEQVLLTHEQAFDRKTEFFSRLKEALPEVVILEVPAAAVPLHDAVASYLFNSQLITIPEDQGMMLLVPRETEMCRSAWEWVTGICGSNGPIVRVQVQDVRESMMNGGGPACLRLRVVLSPAEAQAVDRRFLLSSRTYEILGSIIEEAWPVEISPADLGTKDCWSECWNATRRLRAAILESGM